MKDVTNLHGPAVNLDTVILLSSKSSMFRLLELDGGNTTRLSIGAISESGAANRANDRLKVFL